MHIVVNMRLTQRYIKKDHLSIINSKKAARIHEGKPGSGDRYMNHVVQKTFDHDYTIPV